MNNHEVVRNLPVEELAEMLVKFEEVNVGDEDFNGEWVDFYEECYTCPDGSRFCMDYDGALEYTIDWLNSESSDEHPGKSSISVEQILKAMQEIEDLAYHPSWKKDITAESMCIILKVLQTYMEN